MSSYCKRVLWIRESNILILDDGSDRMHADYQVQLSIKWTGLEKLYKEFYSFVPVKFTIKLAERFFFILIYF